ncbi:MAG: hypothetical protein CHACPFDD_00164 [Phycisphaerae bacterium]|nr:hypothetical protein [Phycisphaerae bacterium]
MRSRHSTGLALFALAALTPAALPQTPAGDAFFYQGKLSDGGQPADGLYDFRFGLWDAPADGQTFTQEILVRNVPVVAGEFVVVLNFGGEPFDGDARWLEMSVRPTAGGDWTLLAPRQRLRPTPYALRAAIATSMLWSGLAEVPAGFADGVDDVGSGDGHSLDASDGSPTDALLVDEDGRVGIGTGSPAGRLHVAGGPTVLDGQLIVNVIGGPPMLVSSADMVANLNAERVGGYVAADFALDTEVLSIVAGADGAGSGLDADLLDGQDSAAFAPASHTHAGEAIVSGVVAEQRIDVAVARDSEVLPLVLAGDGPGSDIDADFLDGLNSNAFAPAFHAHSGADITSGTVGEPRIDALLARDSEILPAVLAGDGAGSTLDADLLDGRDATTFANTAHTHSGSDIVSGTVADARIDAAIARDSEILPAVLAGDGAGSTLDADLLDGRDASTFANAAHTHSGAEIVSGTVADGRIDAAITRDAEVLPIVLAADGPSSGLNADLFDNLDSNAFVKPGDVVGGDLAGTFISPTVDALQGRPISPAAPDAGDLLAFDGISWAPQPPAAEMWTANGADIFYTGGNVGIGTSTPSAFDLQLAGHFGPDASDQFDLGSAAAMWRRQYLGNGGLDFGNGNAVVAVDAATGRLQLRVFNAAAAVLDQVSDQEFTFSASDRWQSFTPAITGRMTQLDVARFDGSSTVTLRIYAGEGTGGTLLHTQSVVLPATGSWNNIPLSTPVQVSAGSKYTWRLHLGGSFFMQGSANAYAGGRSESGTSFDWAFQTYVSSGTSEALSIASSGNVGIGTSSPAALLHVNGAAAKPGGGSWTDSSDERLKQKIRPLSAALSRLLALRGVTFEWKQPEKHGDRCGEQIGMLAQEVERVFPDWVGVDPDGYKTLTFRGFEALAVEALREMNDENERLRRKHAELEDRLARLEQELRRISATK